MRGGSGPRPTGGRDQSNRNREPRPDPQRSDAAELGVPVDRPPVDRPPVDRAPPPMARLEQQQRRRQSDDGDDAAPETPSVAWGTDDDGPAPAIVLAPDLPAEPPRDDEDPLTHPLLDLPAMTSTGRPGDDIASVCGVRFQSSGRVQWFDAGDSDYAHNERVLVDSERGSRLGWIAVGSTRRTMAGRDRLRRVIRRANEQDLRGELSGDTDRARVLRLAKDIAAALRLPLKVFRVELTGPIGRGAKLNVYYTSDDRLDLREFVHQLGRDVTKETGGGRIELRQLGVRDEAKAVGGIGSCGLTLCCTTWLPDFVPVSIKMAKDQGLVLSPSKVSGQCGRLKCCLVYEQAGYAELRKGLPKLGKRVIGARGEGRVVEVDVLRQRVRVSYGPGDTEVVPAAEVKPLFAPGTSPPRGPRPPGTGPDRALEVEAAGDDAAPSSGHVVEDEPDDAELGPTDDPSAHYDPLADSADLPDDGTS